MIVMLLAQLGNDARSKWTRNANNSQFNTSSKPPLKGIDSKEIDHIESIAEIRHASGIHLKLLMRSHSSS